MSRTQRRGVIYLRGKEIKDIPKSPMEGFNCGTHEICSIGLLGNGEELSSLSLKKKRLSQNEQFFCEVLKVVQYNPRQLICFIREELGQRADVRTNTPTR